MTSVYSGAREFVHLQTNVNHTDPQVPLCLEDDDIAMNSQKGFWFPSMKFSEITCALEDWGLRVSEDQIQKPTGEVVQSIYLVFLQQLTSISFESLQEPANRALAGIEQNMVCHD